jgi:TIGR03009 family protein
LEEWEEKSSRVKRLEGTFKRVSYDPIFEVESVTEGKYCFEFPDKGSFHQVGLDQKIVDRMQSRKRNAKGVPYKVQPGENERWVCDGKKIFKIEEKSKSYEEIEIPVEDRGQNIRNAPLPFVFGLKANEAKQRYEFELVASGTNEQQIRVKVKPLLPQDLANYREAEVILDRENCLPLAVKLTDPTGEKTDVYSFIKKEMVVNSKGWTRLLAGDPLKPNLNSYRKNVHTNSGDAQQRGVNQFDRAEDDSRTIGPKLAVPRRTAELPDEDQAPVPRRTSRPQSRVN